MDLRGLRPIAIFETSDREKIRFKGPEAHWFLDQLVTNQIEALGPGQGCEALLLTPKGKITAILDVVSIGPDEVLVDADAEHTPSLKDFFSGRIFSTQVDIEDISADRGILRVVGTGAHDIVRQLLGAEPPNIERRSVAGRNDMMTVFRSRPVDGWDLWYPRDERDALMAALSNAGAQTLLPDEWEAMRVAGGVLGYRQDLVTGFLPQEAALESAVHFSKGCYLGQEAVAMAQRGRVPRRFRHLQFRDQAMEGEVFYEDKLVGLITSWADWRGRGFGLAPISSSVPTAAIVEVIGSSRVNAEVHALPGEVMGPSVPSARELRESLARESRGR